MADRSDPNTYVDQWLKNTTDRWERALAQQPPDLFHTKDMPSLPGDMSMKDFIDAVRARIGLGEDRLACLDRPPMGTSPGETLHPSLESWLAEAATRSEAGHTLWPADDPVGLSLGFADQDDSSWHGVKIQRVKDRTRTPEQDALIARIRGRALPG